jgi:tRNA threonylcarbamoyl adenosine modification protein YeaZ
VFELGIEAASDFASVAVLDGERVLASHDWVITTTASRELLAAIDVVLREAGVPRDALGAIAVDAGPGGYGSLRTSVATAQGMAVALGVPLAGVHRLEVAAYPHLAPGAPVVAVHDAGRAGFAWAVYAPCDAPESREPEVLSPVRLDSLEDCVRLAPQRAVWCGDLSAELLDALPRIDGTIAELQDTATPSGDTVARAEMARTRLAAVDVVRLARLHRAYGDAAVVDVTYLRPPSIGARRALG